MSVASWTLIGPANYKPPVKAAVGSTHFLYSFNMARVNFAILVAFVLVALTTLVSAA